MTTVQELVVDAYGCAGDLSDPKRFTRLLRSAIDSVGASLVETIHHRFVPHGLTVCAILKESHFIVSTWPEYDLVIVNIFLCNQEMDTKDCWKVLEAELTPKQTIFHTVSHHLGSQPKKKVG